MTNEVSLGRGIGDLVFGQTRDDVLLIAGKPEVIDEELSADQIEFVWWRYPTRGFDLQFSAQDAFRLAVIDIHDERFVLNNKSLVGAREDDVIAMLTEKNVEITSINCFNEKDEKITFVQLKNPSVSVFAINDRVHIVKLGPYSQEGPSAVRPAGA